MQTIKKRIAEKIVAAVTQINAEAQLNAQDVAAMLEYPPDNRMGDLALPCFRLSKSLRRSPVEIAKVLADAIVCGEYSAITALNGYLNFKISPSAFAARVISEIKEIL